MSCPDVNHSKKMSELGSFRSVPLSKTAAIALVRECLGEDSVVATWAQQGENTVAIADTLFNLAQTLRYNTVWEEGEGIR